MKLYAFGFNTIAVVISDLYLLDPEAHHGAEQGVRLEVRLVERHLDPGALFAAAPITLSRPLWRADLLESVDHPGTLDRVHYHAVFEGWEPCDREFAAGLTSDPVGWVAGKLSDLDGVLDQKVMTSGLVAPDDLVQVRNAVPQISDAIQELLSEVRAGLIGQPPVGQPAEAATRVGWL